MKQVLFLMFLVANSCFASLTFSSERLRAFQNDYIFDQAVILDKELHRPLPEINGITPPEGKLNYAPLVIRNNTGLDSSRLYVVGNSTLQLLAT